MRGGWGLERSGRRYSPRGVWAMGRDCDLRGGGLRFLLAFALFESVAVAVHLQDVDVVGEPVQQRAGQPFRAEDFGPLLKRQIGCDQGGTAFVALVVYEKRGEVDSLGLDIGHELIQALAACDV